LEAGTADAGCGGIDCGHEFEFGEEVPASVCPADGIVHRDAGSRGPLSVGARGPVAVVRRDVPRVALCGVGSPGWGDAVMLNFSAARIYLCLDPTDMRKSFDTLAVMVREHLQGDPLSGTWFVFRGKQGNRLKILYWDRDGYALWNKRLEQGTFEFPKVIGEAAGVSINATELSLILGGVALSAKRRPRYLKSEQSSVPSVNS